VPLAYRSAETKVQDCISDFQVPAALRSSAPGQLLQADICQH